METAPQRHPPEPGSIPRKPGKMPEKCPKAPLELEKGTGLSARVTGNFAKGTGLFAKVRGLFAVVTRLFVKVTRHFPKRDRSPRQGDGSLPLGDRSLRQSDRSPSQGDPSPRRVEGALFREKWSKQWFFAVFHLTWLFGPRFGGGEMGAPRTSPHDGRPPKTRDGARVPPLSALPYPFCLEASSWATASMRGKRGTGLPRTWPSGRPCSLCPNTAWSR